MITGIPVVTYAKQWIVGLLQWHKGGNYPYEGGNHPTKVDPSIVLLIRLYLLHDLL